MHVKICGITRIQDLKTCEKHDPAFIGFINVKRSRRFLDTEKIKKLKSKMKDENKAVLVIEPETVEESIKKAVECGIKNVQLHSLSAEEISRISKINVIRAIGIPKEIDSPKKSEIKKFAKVCNYLLFDSVISGKMGGTGNQIPLEIALKAATIAKRSNHNIKLFIAGGMDTGRIKDEGKVIKETFDYVDVNSGVEDSPGIKDESKISKFMETCRVNL